ncbi:hypothetical protein [Persicitalea sp.]|uniref:hypothetical protein n=1 Tax=Persicitalea sp. TaxID=3100273 RepID=UPI0035940A06
MKNALILTCLFVLSSINVFALGHVETTPPFSIDTTSLFIGLVVGLIVGYLLGSRMGKK